ncbi:SdpI family protein [Nocardia brevicatena]|uniref:SdpI family protein n=1 Tax=Nocardia brevicatena TaxID=37327 RepID=UPI00030DE97C|nr:SdpI family protein [Nocardia brevicatena]
MFVVALVLFVLAISALVTGVLGLTGRLRPNRFFGVRTEAALRDEAAFRAANRIAAPTTIGAATLLGAGALVVNAVDGLVGLPIALGVGVVALYALGIGADAGARAAEAVAPPAPVGGCGQSCGACSLRDTCRPAF